MQLTRLTACGLLVALAACNDAPSAPADLSTKPTDATFTILKPSEYAAYGIHPVDQPAPPKPSPAAARRIQRCEIDNPDSCVPPREPTVAHVDYFTTIDGLYASQFQKAAWMHTFAQAHDNMQSTVLNVSYYSVGGCHPANSLFASSSQTAYGSPIELSDEQVVVYDISAVFTFKIYAVASYTANPGSVVDGVFRQSVDYPSANETCF